MTLFAATALLLGFLSSRTTVAFSPAKNYLPGPGATRHHSRWNHRFLNQAKGFHHVSSPAMSSSSDDSEPLPSRLQAENELVTEMEDELLQVQQREQREQFLKATGWLFGIMCIFGLGFRFGGGNADLIRATMQLNSQRLRRISWLSVVGALLLVRDSWRAIPVWAKPSLLRSTRLTKGGAETSGLLSENDMTDIAVLARKLQALFDVGQAKLRERDEAEGVEATRKQQSTMAPFLALVQLTAQMKERRAYDRTARYRRSGRLGTARDLKTNARRQQLDLYFDFADWAYDESDEGTLAELLQKQGFALLRHDQTALPGYVGHYVAISKAQKLAVIGVKGTSNLEDLLTDCCGLAQSHTLDHSPFADAYDLPTEIRCHEGVLISSLRLLDNLQPFVEELLLPTGYQILIVGHSLGAAGAAMLGLLLRSRLPTLLQEPDRLHVLAYACPPILDYTTAQACAPFIETIVNNSDVIPRASLSNLVIALQLLKDVNAKLVERGLDFSTTQSTLALMKQLAKGTQGDFVMEPDELAASLDRAMATVEKNDPDHLYVPGNVVTLYNCQTENDSSDEEDDDEETTEFVLSSDGATDVLRTIEWNDRMISDHMAPSYRANLQALMAQYRS